MYSTSHIVDLTCAHWPRCASGTCPGMYCAGCGCEDRQYPQCRGCTCHTPAVPVCEPQPDDDELVLLGEVAPLARGGLFIEGIATTRGWNSYEQPLAAGLVTLSGKTTRTMPGLSPRNMVVKLPLPVLWRHESDKLLGEMYAAAATRDALHFKACIPPPGTPGYDPKLLTQVWADIRSGDVQCVSFTTKRPDDDGAFRGVELSVCEKGANPAALILKAVFPDGHAPERPAPYFDPLSTHLVFKSWYSKKYEAAQEREDSHATR